MTGVVGIKGVYFHPVNMPQFGNRQLGVWLPATALAKPLTNDKHRNDGEFNGTRGVGLMVILCSTIFF